MASPSGCPPAADTVYSPFTRASQSEYFAYTNSINNACWWWAICVLSSADAARNQQFSATALVMGLVPLTLKDVAWPERRVVLISRPLPRHIETIIRALGIVPSIYTSAEKTDQVTFSSMWLYRWTQRLSQLQMTLLLAINTLVLAIAYAALAIMEVYSKRSSLGCTYPVFILTWYLIAVFPAAVDTAFRQAGPSGQHEESATMAASGTSRSSDPAQPAKKPTTHETRLSHSATTMPRDPAPAGDKGQSIPQQDMSPVQSQGKPWLVQLLWAIYYIAGTLVYTSIMAVTVIELFVWVVISATTTQASSLLSVHGVGKEMGTCTEPSRLMRRQRKLAEELREGIQKRKRCHSDVSSLCLVPARSRRLFSLETVNGERNLRNEDCYNHVAFFFSPNPE